jgi:formylglycine-generating enzyme required for sulfatase activity
MKKIKVNISRVDRGGSWDNYVSYCRSMGWSWAGLGALGDDIGFRLMRRI